MKHHCKPAYTGHWPHHAHDCHPPAAHQQQHGFCHSCCQPASSCRCHHKECRKESKDLLVLPNKPSLASKADGQASLMLHAQFMLAPMMEADKDVAEIFAEQKAIKEERIARAGIKLPFKLGYEQTFIGGGCCVHLSIEYMPTARDVPFSGVAVAVKDSKGTVLAWAKSIDEAHTGYQIQEDIITTHPGAELAVVAINAIARVRWCEVFSETCC